LGVDGWLYIAGGDFGFMNAEGTDGRRLTHRGGGVIRVRPDGTGLELYSTGTRNILEVAISPQMEMFARDNTNDGGGWDVRLHHFTGNDDHGYPRLYKNFPEECVPPLADYGGGSGCGAVYLDEPGFGSWNDAPLTADWGTGGLYHHQVERQGATFRETRAPEPLVRLTRPTDADVDGNSRLYVASWRGATFKWNGPDVGYIVCVQPRDYQPTPLPDFASVSDARLIELMESPSHRRRLAAQRELVHRGNDAWQQLHQRAIASRPAVRNLIDELQTTASDHQCIAVLKYADSLVVHTAIRCLAERRAHAACFEALDAGAAPAEPLLRALAMMHEVEVVDALIERLAQAEGSLRRQLLTALCRLHFREGEWKGNSWGTRPDTRGPYYQPEPWEQSERIAQLLQNELADAPPAEAAWLLTTMRRNRISIDSGLDRLLRQAESDPRWLAPAVEQLAAAEEVPPRGLAVLIRAAKLDPPDPQLLSQVIAALARGRQWSSVPPTASDAPAANGSERAAAVLLGALERLEQAADDRAQVAAAARSLRQAGWLDQAIGLLDEAAAPSAEPTARWADAALLLVAENGRSSPEARVSAEQTINELWQSPAGRLRMMEGASLLGSSHLNEAIWRATEDADPKVASWAREIVRQLKIKPPQTDDTPKVASLATNAAKQAILDLEGNVSLGRRIFARANCSLCHTVAQDEVQRGPYLGNIAKTYKSPELVDALLEPNKTIAQGFTTNSFLTVDGSILTGFVTDEQSDQVVIRDAAGKEYVLPKAEIEARKKLTTSVMPTGLLDDYSVAEVASLIAYLQSLAAGQ
jgi:putative heme-binding domain-containing protein